MINARIALWGAWKDLVCPTVATPLKRKPRISSAILTINLKHRTFELTRWRECILPSPTSHDAKPGVADRVQRLVMSRVPQKVSEGRQPGPPDKSHRWSIVTQSA